MHSKGADILYNSSGTSRINPLHRCANHFFTPNPSSTARNSTGLSSWGFQVICLCIGVQSACVRLSCAVRCVCVGVQTPGDTIGSRSGTRTLKGLNFRVRDFSESLIWSPKRNKTQKKKKKKKSVPVSDYCCSRTTGGLSGNQYETLHFCSIAGFSISFLTANNNQSSRMRNYFC